MKDPSCLTAGCPFSDGARGGECTGTLGVLSAAEIQKVINNGAMVTFDAAAAVEIVTWDTDQWVSWDSVKTLKIKVDFANKRCLGGYVSHLPLPPLTLLAFDISPLPCGFRLREEMLTSFRRTMVWAIDLDDGTLIDSLGANMGRPKKNVPPEPGLIGQDLGSGWPDEL